MGASPSQPQPNRPEADLGELKTAVYDAAKATSLAMQPGGSFHTYRLLKLERDLACARAPGQIRTRADDERCVQLQMETLKAQWKALEDTQGGSLVVEFLESL